MNSGRPGVFEPKSFLRVLGVIWAVFAASTAGYNTLGGGAGWTLLAAVSGFVGFNFTVFGLPIIVCLLPIARRQKCERADESLRRTNGSGEPVIHIQLERYVRVTATLISIAFVALTVRSISASAIVPSAIVLGLGFRVGFAMDVRADVNGVRIRRLLRTMNIPAGDIIAVRFVPESSLHVGRRTITRGASLTLFGRDYEPFALSLFLDDPQVARPFAREVNHMLGIHVDPADTDRFDGALRVDGARLLQNTERLKMAILSMGLAFIPLSVAGRALQDFDGDPGWYDAAWFVPMCAVASALGVWMLFRIAKTHLHEYKWGAVSAQVLAIPESQGTGQHMVDH